MRLRVLPPLDPADASPFVKGASPSASPATPTSHGAGPGSGPKSRRPLFAIAGIIAAVAILFVFRAALPPDTLSASVSGNVAAQDANPIGEGVDGRTISTPNVVTPTDVPSMATRTSAPSGTPLNPEAVALHNLRASRAASLKGLRLDGRWVPQLASKYDGVKDLTQLSERGDHVFHYVDIGAEHDRLVALAESYGAVSLLLLGSDFGTTQNALSQKIWVTIADLGGLGSGADAGRACQSLYPDLTGRAMANVCVPRRLIPPGG